MNEVLSQTEIDNLLSAVEMDDFGGGLGDSLGGMDFGGDLPPHRNSLMDKSIVKMYDFVRPDKFSKDQIQSIQIIHEIFARLITTSISNQVNGYVHVHLASVDQLTFEDFSRSMPNPTGLFIINMDPLNGQAILEIDPTILFSSLDNMLGGEGESLKANRPLTDIETSIMEGYVIRMLGDLREAWSKIIDLRPKLGNVETNIQFAQIAQPNDMVLMMCFEVRVGDVEGMINLCVPYSTIETVIHKLSKTHMYSRKTPTYDPDKLTELMKTAPVEIGVEIGSGKTTLNTLLNMQVGDEIELPQNKDNDLTITVNGIPKFKGDSLVCLHSDKQSVKITKSLCQSVEPIKEQTKEPTKSEIIVKRQKTMIKRLTRQNLAQQLKIKNIINTIKYSKPVDDIPEKPVSVEPFDYIRTLNARTIVEIISNEHPQTMALVLSHLSKEMASGIIAHSPIEEQADIAKRIIKMRDVRPEIIREVERIIEHKSERVIEKHSEKFSNIGGMTAMIQMLELVDRSTEKNIIETLEEEDPELAEEIKKHMFVFEDIVMLSDDEIKHVIGDSVLTTIAVALKTVDDEVKDKIIRNFSATQLKQFNKIKLQLTPIKDVETAQKIIVGSIKRLDRNGAIHINKSDLV